MLNTPEAYDLVWAELNAELLKTEKASGLGDAIAQLEVNQQETGFIKDSLLGVERHVYAHPDKPDCQFRIQFNAKRAQRFNGAGTVSPPDGSTIANGGCFLCRDNVRWQQNGAELGYDLPVNGRNYHAWMNPFPLMPGHVVVASNDHEPQDWEFAPDVEYGQSIARLIQDLLSLAARMPGYVGFYNGVNAGASIPGHLHYQFFRRPEFYPHFPLERRMAELRSDGTAPVADTDYPVPVVKWEGSPETLAPSVERWIRAWAERNAERMFRLTANIIVSGNSDGSVTLYFVPRDRTRARGEGMSGLIGGLEVLGELVFSNEEEQRFIASGEIDYFTVANILESVRTPLYAELEG